MLKKGRGGQTSYAALHTPRVSGIRQPALVICVDIKVDISEAFCSTGFIALIC